MGRLNMSGQTGREPLQADASLTEQSSLLRALTGVDQQTDLAVNRTRRRVLSANLDRHQQRRERVKQSRMVIVVCLAFLTLLTPALWTSVESFLGGAHFADPQMQTFLLPLMLFPGIIAAAIVVFKKHHDGENRREL